MAHYHGVNGVAREVTKRYHGVDNVAREVTKAYHSVDGVAREYFLSGISWRKYHAVEEGYYEEESESTAETRYHGFLEYNSTRDYYYSSYGFSSETGYYGIGPNSLTVTENTTAEDIDSVIAGTYAVWPERVLRIKEVTRVSEGVSTVGRGLGYYGTADLELNARFVFTNYGKYPYSDCGTVQAPEGELPEEGALIEGSIDAGYCVLQIGSDYYYYELEE